MKKKQSTNQADLFEDQPQQTTEMKNKAIEQEVQNIKDKVKNMSKQLKFLPGGIFHKQPDTSNQ